MNKRLPWSALLLLLAVTFVSCVRSPRVGETQPASMAQVSTAAAMTLQALAPASADTAVRAPGSASGLLPHSLYFLSNDGQGVTQVYRLESDGRTRRQITFEPLNVWDYAVSAVDGIVVYETNHQLLLAAADGSNRRVLVDGVPSDAQAFYRPVISPDGKMLAYAQGGLNLYDLTTGVSQLVIEDQVQDMGNGQFIAIETYSPESYSPDGTKLLLALGHWEVAPSHAVYYPATKALVRHTEVDDYIYCCSFHGGPVWSPDSSRFYGVASTHDFAYKSGEMWRVDAANGSITRIFETSGEMLILPKELYVGPDGQLYFFLGTYSSASGYFDAPLLELVRSAPDGVTNRARLRSENFVLMNEALWAPDASFVIVSTVPGRDWDVASGVLELYYTEGERDSIWLAASGRQLKWGP